MLPWDFLPRESLELSVMVTEYGTRTAHLCLPLLSLVRPAAAYCHTICLCVELPQHNIRIRYYDAFLCGHNLWFKYDIFIVLPSSLLCKDLKDAIPTVSVTQEWMVHFCWSSWLQAFLLDHTAILLYSFSCCFFGIVHKIKILSSFTHNIIWVSFHLFIYHTIYRFILEIVVTNCSLLP